MTAWKDLERRVCRDLGGERRGPTGREMSDCSDDVPFAVQCKRSRRLGPPVLAKWILQARADGRKEKKPWLVVVQGHSTPKKIVTLDYDEFLALLRQTDRLPREDGELVGEALQGWRPSEGDQGLPEAPLSE